MASVRGGTMAPEEGGVGVARSFRIGTRTSTLAMAQAEWVAARLDALGVSVALVGIETAGDRVHDRRLDQMGERGVFTSALEAALADGAVDAAVHSLKDLPTRLPPELVVAGIPEREDARDVAVTRDGTHLAALPAGSRVGTSSVRRAALLRHAHPHLVVVPVRGNLDTRLHKLDQGECDALVLAAAGLIRLGRAERITEYLDPVWMVPAPAQGALAIEVRAGDADAVRLAGTMDHEASRAAAMAERRILDALGGNCQLPVGVWAVHDQAVGEWALAVFVGDSEGQRAPIRLNWRGAVLERGVLWVVAELLALGAAGPHPEAGAPEGRRTS